MIGRVLPARRAILNVRPRVWQSGACPDGNTATVGMLTKHNSLTLEPLPNEVVRTHINSITDSQKFLDGRGS
jgi:hypothetical protein